MYRVYRYEDGCWIPDHIECGWQYLPEWGRIDKWNGTEWVPYRDENGKPIY